MGYRGSNKVNQPQCPNPQHRVFHARGRSDVTAGQQPWARHLECRLGIESLVCILTWMLTRLQANHFIRFPRIKHAYVSQDCRR